MSITSPISCSAAYSGYGSARPADVPSAGRISIASMLLLRRPSAKPVAKTVGTIVSRSQAISRYPRSLAADPVRPPAYQPGTVHLRRRCRPDTAAKQPCRRLGAMPPATDRGRPADRTGWGKQLIKTTKPDRNDVVRVTFVLPADEPPGAVSVVGNFNDWNPFTHPLRRRANGTRSAVVTVPAGSTLHFRYLAEGGMWFDDETAPASGGPDVAITV